MRTAYFKSVLTVLVTATVFFLSACGEPLPPEPLVRADGGRISNSIEQRNASELDAPPQVYMPEEKPAQPAAQ